VELVRRAAFPRPMPAHSGNIQRSVRWHGCQAGTAASAATEFRIQAIDPRWEDGWAAPARRVAPARHSPTNSAGFMRFLTAINKRAPRLSAALRYAFARYGLPPRCAYSLSSRATVCVSFLPITCTNGLPTGRFHAGKLRMDTSLTTTGFFGLHRTAFLGKFGVADLSGFSP
jgi:hypothetical protein